MAAGLLLLAGAACSTVETRRADPATADTTTVRSLADVETCLSDGFDKRHIIPQFRPTANGGSYILAGQGYVQWVIDIHDDGDRRHIVAHGVTSIWGQDKRLIGIVQACA